MKSKEAIRNTILNYTNQIWGTKKIERLDLLVQMMVNGLTNELFLAQNKLNDLDTTLLEKIARRLTPEKYTAVRPAHTILQMKSDDPITLLDRSNTFTLEWIPDGFFHEKNEGITFHPIASTRLFNLNIDHLFYHKKLFVINDEQEKELLVETTKQPTDNSVWLGLDIDPEITQLQGLSFYLDFAHLSEIDELYDVLPYTKCCIGDKEVSLAPGFPVDSSEYITDADKDILHLYNDHYLTINEAVSLREMEKERIPKGLSEVLQGSKTDALKPKYWIKLLFPSYFTPQHLTDIFIAVNAFPVSNKRLISQTIIKDNFTSMITLSSEQGEKLQAIDAIVDNKGREFVSERESGHNEAGTYHLETINKVFLEEYSLIDYMEQLLDLIDDERAVFTGLDKDQVGETLLSLTKAEGEDEKKTDYNNKHKGESLTRLQINPYEDTSTIKLDYWVTFGDQVDNIPAKKLFDADRTGKLEGMTALSLCEVYGSKEFTDIQDLMSIDKYIFTSKDRIITEHNIRTFCESELGKAIEEVEIKLDGKISPKPKEGIIRVIKLTLIPSVGHPDLLYKKGVLKSLKTRLEQRSPSDFVYDISIKDSI